MKRKIILFCLIFLLTAGYAFSSNHSVRLNQSTNRKREIAALLKAYDSRIESVGIQDGEIVLSIRGRYIYHKDGKMLSEEELSGHKEYDSIFYFYRAGPQRGIPAPSKYPRNRSSAFLNALAGQTEEEIRASCTWLDFLEHRVFAHRICIEPLRRVDRQIQLYARSSDEVQSFLRNLKLIYSLKRRRVAGTDNMSYHAYGLAIDLIPKSYRGKQVYWRWSSLYFPDWGTIPFSKRWQPPFEIIEAFEENGFLWGGKWYHFDTVHFEYRPEILYFSESFLH